jgi:hypothetical protein
MIKVAGVQMIDGMPAVGLFDPKDGSRLYIALQGSALPVRIDGPGGRGSMNISGYGQPVTLVDAVACDRFQRRQGVTRPASSVPVARARNRILAARASQE